MGMHEGRPMSCCRSPRQPSKLLVKRLIGLEGDWLLVSSQKDIVKVPKVTTMLSGYGA
jgi:signal peptidase I